MISTAEPQYIAYYIRGAISFMISNDSITDRKNNENDLQSAATKIGVQDRQLWHKLNLHRTGIVIHLETENRYPSVSNSLLPPPLPPGKPHNGLDRLFIVSHCQHLSRYR